MYNCSPITRWYANQSLARRVIIPAFVFMLPFLIWYMFPNDQYYSPYAPLQCRLPLETTKVQLDRLPFHSTLYSLPDSFLQDTSSGRKCGGTTLVTALFNTHMTENKDLLETKYWKRPFSTYMRWLTHVMSLNMPMVLHVEPAVLQHVLDWRCSQMHQAQIVVTDLSRHKESSVSRRVQQLQSSPSFRRRVRRPKRPEMVLPKYVLINFLKPDFVMHAVDTNPFDTQHFFWIDAGYGHGEKTNAFPSANFPQCNKLRREIVDDRLYFVYPGSEPLDTTDCLRERSMYDQHSSFFGGNFFGGRANAFRHFQSKVHEHIKRTLSEEILDDDQSIYWSVWCQNPELFDVRLGSWYTALSTFA